MMEETMYNTNKKKQMAHENKVRGQGRSRVRKFVKTGVPVYFVNAEVREGSKGQYPPPHTIGQHPNAKTVLSALDFLIQ